MKKSIVKREERLCVSKGGGVYEKINSEVEKERLYVSTKRGGGGGEKEEEYFGGSIQKFFVMDPEPKINNFGSATLVIFFILLFLVNNV